MHEGETCRSPAPWFFAARVIKRSSGRSTRPYTSSVGKSSLPNRLTRSIANLAVEPSARRTRTVWPGVQLLKRKQDRRPVHRVASHHRAAIYVGGRLIPRAPASAAVRQPARFAGQRPLRRLPPY